jgi:hypothetical protein
MVQKKYRARILPSPRPAEAFSGGDDFSSLKFELCGQVDVRRLDIAILVKAAGKQGTLVEIIKIQVFEVARFIAAASGQESVAYEQSRAFHQRRDQGGAGAVHARDDQRVLLCVATALCRVVRHGKCWRGMVGGYRRDILV